MSEYENNAAKPIATSQKCKICGGEFITASFDKPNRDLCPICRKRIAKEKRLEREAIENEMRLRKKEKEHEIFLKRLNNYNVVSLADIHPCDNTLYVLGNGFDIMHRVKSSYYSFRDSLGKNNNLRETLEAFLISDDIWADFENALARFNVRAMCADSIVDNHLDISGAYDEDSGMAEFYMAVEMAADPITTVAQELPRRFRRWVETLTVGTDDRPLSNLFRGGRVLTFNYTEFAENLYAVPREQICYIHGCRKNKKAPLILGHMPNASDAMYDFDDGYRPRKSKARQYMIGAAQDNIYRIIAESDESLTKHCDEIISAHRPFFESLHDIKDVVIIGHSMSDVDMDYFEEVAHSISNVNTVNWYIGCYGLGDLENMESMLKRLDIPRERAIVFRTDLILTAPRQATSEKIPVPVSVQEKPCGISQSGSWRATFGAHTLRIYQKNAQKANFEIIFSQEVSHAVFSPDERIMFSVVRGLYDGIFLFAYESCAWHFISELQSIPNQRLLNPRLRHVYLTKSTVTFVYNNRVRIYSLSDGRLAVNRARRYSKEHFYHGIDILNRFL